jgi:plastocyanin
MEEQKSSSDMTKWIIIAVVAIFLLGGGAYFLKSSSTAVAPSPTDSAISQVFQDSSTAPIASTDPSQASVAGQQANVKEFTIDGSNYKFAPNTISVNQGDTVKINFKNTGGFHNFVIDEFNAKTKTIPINQEDSIEFVADKAGSFQFYCSVGNHRAMGMVGTLTVN